MILFGFFFLPHTRNHSRDAVHSFFSSRCIICEWEPCHNSRRERDSYLIFVHLPHKSYFNYILQSSKQSSPSVNWSFPSSCKINLAKWIRQLVRFDSREWRLETLVSIRSFEWRYGRGVHQQLSSQVPFRNILTAHLFTAQCLRDAIKRYELLASRSIRSTHEFWWDG